MWTVFPEWVRFRLGNNRLAAWMWLIPNFGEGNHSPARAAWDAPVFLSCFA